MLDAVQMGATVEVDVGGDEAANVDSDAGMEMRTTAPVTRRVREWPIIPGLAAVGALLYAALSMLAPGGFRATAGNVVLTGSAFLGAAVAFATWRRIRASTWLLIGAYCALWGLGQCVWAYFELIEHRAVLFPSPADVGYLGAVPFALLATVRLPRRPEVRALIGLLDGAIVALSAVTGAWLIFGSTIFAAEQAGDLWLLLVYPATDIVVLTAMVTALPMVTVRSRPQVVCAIAGFAAITFADVAFAVLSTSDDYATGSPIDLGWIVGFLLIAAGAVQARQGPAVSHERKVESLRWTGLFLPGLFVVPAAVGVLAVEVARGSIPSAVIYLGVALVITLGIRQGVTLLESERRAALLDRELTYDTVTGLWNRRTLTQHVDHLIASSRHVAVLVLDIDAFRDLNDSLGRDAGDAALKTVGERLRRHLGEEAIVARVGGDEFAVVLTDVHMQRALTAANALQEEIGSPLWVSATTRHVTASVGIAVQSGQNDAITLLRDAELALTSAKRQGKNCRAVFEQRLHTDTIDRIALTGDLELATREGQLLLHYQPVHRLTDGELVGAEALVRWQHPTRGLLSPLEFLPLAEATPHIDAIGSWVLREACRFTAELIRSGTVPDTFHVSVNVSPRQLHGGRIVDLVERVLTETGLAPQSLVLELTESSLIDVDAALSALWAIRTLGVRLAVDDFGTGFSALSYLDRLPLDILKIDKSFVSRIENDATLRAMTHAILAMAHALKLTSVAEGVERPEQLAELRSRGCTAAQGFLWSPPITDTDFATMAQHAFGMPLLPR